MTSALPIPAGLDDVPAAVDSALAAFFAQAVPTAAAIDPQVGTAAAALAEFVLGGGKRVRPVFAYAGWLAGKSSHTASEVPDDTDALRVAAALELVQACALIHDDIIDRSDTRRGRATVHRDFEQRHRWVGWAGDAAHHGVATAILLGDLALSWADDMVHGHLPGDTAGHQPPHPLPAAVGQVWSSMRTEVLGGQYLDIVNEASGDDTVDAAYRVMEFKTAAYTVARPLELGASLAGAPQTLIGDLRSVGHDLGIAFQLRDDLLGVFGDPAQTGKPSGDDLVAGKRTALLAVGLARAAERDPAVADTLRHSVGRPLTDDEVGTARAILTDVGARDEMEQRISALLTSALDTLAAADLGDAVRAELVAFATRISHRST
ncbi:polyprenyl synthetase family protein [Gordonia sp. HNM0687]|uniref:Polyprenyl synthetase family protein n=1 Tax=Gordonia mangrovi TaxID=2665643 RepID=A0A6L7GMJ2_9ACTN|nr:polyprenyl synthetase family protein [Gordonia mangrovi]MXP21106.1 polyprenyl synthetase family protein [Gordonia mangrovi]UVF78356.1 polyprenyl synthetase family protein [Gordonia mangrovi]